PATRATRRPKSPPAASAPPRSPRKPWSAALSPDSISSEKWSTSPATSAASTSSGPGRPPPPLAARCDFSSSPPRRIVGLNQRQVPVSASSSPLRPGPNFLSPYLIDLSQHLPLQFPLRILQNISAPQRIIALVLQVIDRVFGGSRGLQASENMASRREQGPLGL